MFLFVFMESCQLWYTCIFVSGLCALWTCQRVERRPDIDRYSWFSDSFKITSFFEKEGRDGILTVYTLCQKVGEQLNLYGRVLIFHLPHNWVIFTYLECLCWQVPMTTPWSCTIHGSASPSWASNTVTLWRASLCSPTPESVCLQVKTAGAQT